MKTIVSNKRGASLFKCEWKPLAAAAGKSRETKAGRPARKEGILCGTDFSIHAIEAANVAAALASRSGEKMFLVHAQEYDRLGDTHPDALITAHNKVRELLENEVARLRKRHPLVEAQILSGAPPRAIIDAAVATGARCLVVASLGHIAFSRLLIGSVAERVAEAAPVPTLVVRQSNSLVAWTRGKRRLKILVGHDLSPTADAALAWVRELPDIASCDVIVAHVNWPAEAIGRDSPLQVPLVGNLPEVAEILTAELRARTAAALGNLPLELRVIPSWGRPDANLIDLAEKERADLIVVGTHQRHGLERLWLGSVSRGILHHAPMNVAVVPPPRPPDLQ